MQKSKSELPSVPSPRDLIWPVLTALDALGKTANNADIDATVRADLNLPPEVTDAPYRSDRRTVLAYHTAWARTEAGRTGLIEKAGRRTWRITPAGTLALNAKSGVGGAPETADGVEEKLAGPEGARRGTRWENLLAHGGFQDVVCEFKTEGLVVYSASRPADSSRTERVYVTITQATDRPSP